MKSADRAAMKARKVFLATIAASAIGVTGTLATTASAQAAGQTPGYFFSTLNNAGDPTFNQLLGINNQEVVAGYFGSGVANHPNKGYLLGAPYGQGNYLNENFPGSAQTQVTGLNNSGVTVGFWAGNANGNFGFWAKNGVFHTVSFPAAGQSSPPLCQLLGINDHGIAVGFYTTAAGSERGFTYDIKTGTFSPVLKPGAPNANLTATAISSRGDVAGFITFPGGTQKAFVRFASGRFETLAVKGATTTQALGINSRGEVVGVSTGTGLGSEHGFTWTAAHGFQTVDDPHGVGATTINGVNDRGDLVGFYIDDAGNTDGMLAIHHG